MLLTFWRKPFLYLTRAPFFFLLYFSLISLSLPIPNSARLPHFPPFFFIFFLFPIPHSTHSQLPHLTDCSSLYSNTPTSSPNSHCPPFPAPLHSSFSYYFHLLLLLLLLLLFSWFDFNSNCYWNWVCVFMFVCGPYVWVLLIDTKFGSIYCWWINFKLVNLVLWFY